MSGVTHFERRGGTRKVHPECPFCHKTFMVTPKRISAAGGPRAYIERFRDHLLEEMAQPRETAKGMDAVAYFAVMVYGNC